MGMRNKRGIFFMMLTIVLLSIFVISITFFSGYALRKSTQQRVESLSDFVNNVESDLSRQLFIVGARSVFLMQDEMIFGSPHYLGEGNTQAFLEEIFFSGTINGRNDPDVLEVTDGIKFSDLKEAVQKKAQGISANVQFFNPHINITQEDPWNIKITLVTDFYVTDNNGLASWNKTLESVTYIAITNFTDPLYAVSTNGQENPDIVLAPAGASVQQHITNGYYLNYSGAPSFIDRLEGNIVDPEYPDYGIVSLVDKSKSNIPNFGRPIVDYIYFTNLPYTPCQVGSNLLTVEHRSLYGVSTCS